MRDMQMVAYKHWGWKIRRMIPQKLWVSQNFHRISRVSQSRFLAVMCVSQAGTKVSRSRDLIRRCLAVAILYEGV